MAAVLDSDSGIPLMFGVGGCRYGVADALISLVGPGDVNTAAMCAAVLTGVD